jgi:hypothetical protein
VGTSRSFHGTRENFDLLEIQDRWITLRTIVTRLRSLGSNVIARDTVERNFIVP